MSLPAMYSSTSSFTVMLARTRSYWLRSSPATREKVEANLRWYLHDHLGFAPGDLVSLPYRSDSFVVSAD